MSTDLMLEIARVRAPIAKAVYTDSDSPMYGGGEVCLAISGTAVRVIVPTWMRGKYCTFTAAGASADVLFGGSDVEVVYGQESTVSTEAITVHANTGRRCPDGVLCSMVVPNDSTILYMSVEASGAGKLYIGIASDNVVTKAR